MFSLKDVTNYFIDLDKKYTKHPSFMKDVVNKQLMEEQKLIYETNSLCPTNLTDRNMKAEDIRRALDQGYADGNILKSLMCMNNSEFMFPLDSSTGTSYKIRKDITDMNIIGAPSVFGLAATIDIEKRDPDDKTVDNKRLFVVKVPRNISDSIQILHEYFVGIFALNNLKSYIPNFAYVFGLFRCSPPYVDKIGGKKNKVLSFCQNDTDYKQSTYILYENITNSVVLNDFIKKCTPIQILNVLVQIIFTISMAYEMYEFTHYDLHIENVLIKELKDEIIIPYRRKNGSILYVRTKYIAVIIDLERAHVKVNDKHYGYLDAKCDVFPNRGFPMYDIFKILLFILNSAILGNNEFDYKEMKNVTDDLLLKKYPALNHEVYTQFKDLLRFFFTDYNGQNTAEILESRFYDMTRYAFPHDMTPFTGNPEFFYDDVLLKKYADKLDTFVSVTVPNNGVSIYGCANLGTCMNIPQALQKYTHADFNIINNAYDYYDIITELSSNRNTDVALLQEVINFGSQNYVTYMKFLLEERQKLIDEILKVSKVKEIMQLSSNNTPDKIKFDNVFLKKYRKYVATLVMTIDSIKTLINIEKIITSFNNYFKLQSNTFGENGITYSNIDKDNKIQTDTMRKNINAHLLDLYKDLKYVETLNKKQVLKFNKEAGWLFETFKTLQYALSTLPPL